MIDIYRASKYCKEYTKIENYEKAITDTTQTWHCHHRAEVVYSSSELKSKGMYYNVLPCDLIFLTAKEHNNLHKQAAGHSFNPNNEYREKQRKRISSLIWVNNGTQNKRVKKDSIPDGYVIGKLPHKKECPHKGKTWKVVQGRRVWYDVPVEM